MNQGGLRAGTLRRGLLLGALFLLPGLVPPLAAPLAALLPVPVFIIDQAAGRRVALETLRNAAMLALGLGLVTGSLPQVSLALMVAPAGLLLKRCGEADSPARAGLRGLAALLVLGLLFWTGMGMASGVNPYREMLTAIDQALTEGLRAWTSDKDLPADTLLMLHESVDAMRRTIPRIMPGLLVVAALNVIWANLALGNRLLARAGERAPWPPFREWLLPDPLVWLLIAAGAGLLLPPLRTLALNLLLVVGNVYALQGLAVFVHLLERWKTPPVARVVLYVLVLLQSYGVLMLMVFGVADTWFDFRRLRAAGEQDPGGG